jgi:hypothetical protein
MEEITVNSNSKKQKPKFNLVATLYDVEYFFVSLLSTNFIEPLRGKPRASFLTANKK